MDVFSSCLRPTRIYNRYTHTTEFVSCGKCPACLNRKSSKMTNRVRQEIASHRYALFFTLTYDNEYIPRFEVFQDSKNRYQIRPVGRLCDTYSSYPLSSPLVGNEHPRLFQLGDRPFVPRIENDDVANEFGVCSKYDIQCFLKRLRYKISKLPINEKDKKFRYFICSEYGPRTFRPHYHGIIFFDSSELLAPLQNGIVTSWGKFERQNGHRNAFIFRPFANIALTRSYIKLCDINTSFYVASYVVGSDYLPKVLQHSITRPFFLYSQSPCFGSYKVCRNQMLEDVNRGTITRVIQNFDKSSESVRLFRVPYSKSDFCSVFCKCKGYSTLSSVAKSHIYSFVYDNKKEWRDIVEVYAFAHGFTSVKKFIRKHSEFSLRNYLKTHKGDLYFALEMDNDTNFYASQYCCSMIEKFPFFSRLGFASPVDAYLHVMERFITLSKSYTYGQFVDTLNRWISTHGNVANLAAYQNFNLLHNSNYRYFSELPFCIRNFVSECRIRRFVCKQLYEIDYTAFERYAETSYITFVNFENEEITKFNDRQKSKKANNAILYGSRKLY